MNIPKSQVNGLKAVADLTPDEVSAILAGLSASEIPSGGFVGLLSSVANSIPSKTRLGTEEIVRLIVSLSTLRADLGDLLPDFIADLTKAMGNSGFADLHLDPQKQQQFQQNINRLLSFEALNIAAKVIHLRTNYEHVFCRARVLTDLRPVFGDDRGSSPSAMIITHILALHYHEGDELKDLHLAMDEQDVATLKSLLERAEIKQNSLKQLTSGLKIPTVTKVRGEQSMEATVDGKCFPTKETALEEWGQYDDSLSALKKDQRAWFLLLDEFKHNKSVASLTNTVARVEVTQEGFDRLRNAWHQEYGASSSFTKITNCPSYREIVRIGEAVLPLIFEDLRRRPEPDHWFEALAEITHANPIAPEDRGYARRMAKAWLKWARTHGYA